MQVYICIYSYAYVYTYTGFDDKVLGFLPAQGLSSWTITLSNLPEAINLAKPTWLWDFSSKVSWLLGFNILETTTVSTELWQCALMSTSQCCLTSKSGSRHYDPISHWVRLSSSPCPILLMFSVRLGIDKYQYFKSSSPSPTHEANTLIWELSVNHDHRTYCTLTSMFVWPN